MSTYREYTVPVTYDKALRLTAADAIQHIDPVGAEALRNGVGLTVFVKPEDAPPVGKLISQVKRKP